MTEKPVLSAPPVIRRAVGGRLDFEVAGHPVEGVVEIHSVCDANGSYTNIIIHNSAVIFAVEKDDEEEAAAN